MGQYDIGSVLIFGLGYPISQALLLSFFSKALGPTPQVRFFSPPATTAGPILSKVSLHHNTCAVNNNGHDGIIGLCCQGGGCSHCRLEPSDRTYQHWLLHPWRDPLPLHNGHRSLLLQKTDS